MNLYSIALRNIWRKKTRALLITSGLIVGIATAVALFLTVESMRLALGDQIDEFGSNIVIVPRAEGMDISYGGAHVSRASIDLKQLELSDLEAIKEIPDFNSINIISPKMVAAVNVNGKEALLVGIEPNREFIMKPWYTLAAQSGLNGGEGIRGLAMADLKPEGIIAGAEAAAALELQAGSQITINRQNFVVQGILNPLGSAEDGLFFANLAAVQTLLGRPGEISMVEISAYCNACPVEELAAQISAVLPNGEVTALRQAALIREETIDKFSAFSILLSAVALTIAALLVFTTMMAAVHERTREIGIFRALGFRKSHIIRIFFIEAGLVGLLGGGAGYLAGNLVASLAGTYLTGSAVPATWQPELFYQALLLSTTVALIASAFPAGRAAGLNPAEALRFI